MCTIAVSLLRGSAAKWFSKLEKFDQHPTMLPGFEKIFLAKFEELDAENNARDRLKTLVQTGSVRDYVTVFDSVLLDIPTADEDDMIHAFVYGLK